MGERVAPEGAGEVIKGCLVWGPEEDFRNIVLGQWKPLGC